MKIIFNLLFALICVSIMAQGPTDFGPDSIYGKNLQQAKMYQLKVDHYKSMKKTGGILTFSGAPCIIGGVVLLLVGVHNKNVYTDDMYADFRSWDKGDRQVIVGSVIGGVGVAAIVSGFILHGVGNRKLKEYQLKRDGLKIHPYATLKSKGLTLTYRF
jgi:hypothetical protein